MKGYLRFKRDRMSNSLARYVKFGVERAVIVPANIACWEVAYLMARNYKVVL